MTESRQNLDRMAVIYKQIDAPVGHFSLDSIAFATKATLSTSPGDKTYLKVDEQIPDWNTQRDELAARMIALLDNTGSRTRDCNQSDVHELIANGQRLLAEVHVAAA